MRADIRRMPPSYSDGKQKQMEEGKELRIWAIESS